MKPRSYNERYDETKDKIKKFQSFKWGLILSGKPLDLAGLLMRLIWRSEHTFYADKKTLKIKKRQLSGDSRSVMDVYRICYTYNSNISYKQIADVFYYLVNDNYLRCDYCSTVKKYVHDPFSLRMIEERLRRILKDKNIKF